MSKPAGHDAEETRTYACWTDTRIRWAAFFLFALKMYLIASQPIFAITPAKMDELLSIRQADFILQGQWLGPYDADTLVKGAGFSLFIALSVILGIPLPLAQHLLYALAAWLAVRALRRWLAHDLWALAIFALILWNPVTWELGTMGRVLRHNLVVPLVLLVFAGCFALRTRVGARIWVRAAWGAILGFAAGALWLTREETFWIIPSILVLVAAAVFSARQDGCRWLHLAWPTAVAGLFAAAPVLTVASLNARHYGWFGTVEVRAPEFVGAIGALNRVIPPDGRIPLVPINRSVRQLAYEVSPTFRKLEHELERGSPGIGASGVSAQFTGLPTERMEFADGWGYLAIRDAVWNTGHATNARQALDFYAAMAREINAACDSGALPAGPRRQTLRPVWQPTYTGKALEEAWPFVQGFALGRWNYFKPPESIGDANGLRLFNDLTQWHASPVPQHPEFTMTQTLRWARPRLTLLRWMGKDLTVLGAVVMSLGLVAWTGWCIRDGLRRRCPAYLWWAALAAWGGAAAVIAVSLFMHVTSFPISNPGYYSAAYPLAYLAAGLSIAGAWAAWRSKRVH